MPQRPPQLAGRLQFPMVSTGGRQAQTGPGDPGRPYWFYGPDQSDVGGLPTGRKRIVEMAAVADRHLGSRIEIRAPLDDDRRGAVGIVDDGARRLDHGAGRGTINHRGRRVLCFCKGGARYPDSGSGEPFRQNRQIAGQGLTRGWQSRP